MPEISGTFWVADALPPMARAAREKMTPEQRLARRDRVVEAIHDAGLKMRVRVKTKAEAEAYAEKQATALRKAKIDETPYVGKSFAMSF